MARNHPELRGEADPVLKVFFSYLKKQSMFLVGRISPRVRVRVRSMG
jgi:hypothetical protein